MWLFLLSLLGNVCDLFNDSALCCFIKLRDFCCSRAGKRILNWTWFSHWKTTSYPPPTPSLLSLPFTIPYISFPKLCCILFCLHCIFLPDFSYREPNSSLLVSNGLKFFSEALLGWIQTQAAFCSAGGLAKTTVYNLSFPPLIYRWYELLISTSIALSKIILISRAPVSQAVWVRIPF